MLNPTPPISGHLLDDFQLDSFGQLPFLRIYTQLSSCYACSDETSDDAIIDTLTRGLERLTASFPWLAGQVVCEGASEGHSGIFKIKPWHQLPKLVVKHGRHDAAYPTMDALREAQFPVGMLHESLIAPLNTIPAPSDLADGTPVFLLQLTFIRGGLILTSLTEHQTADMTGQGHIMHLFSKACRNEPFTPDELTSGNLPRHDRIPLLENPSSYQPGPELAYQLIQPSTAASTTSPPPSATWANFLFSAESQSALKSLATTTKTTPFISTDDALSAFIWQSISRIRLPRLPPSSSTSTPTTFERAVDARPYLDIPATYPGLIQNMAYATNPSIHDLATRPLGEIASLLRRGVDPQTSQLGFNTRALATYLHRTADKGTVSFTATADPATDLMFSSWAKIGLQGEDFGMGVGVPEAVRRPGASK
ncbi:hypothetical protein FE257_004511 [Aspergillus nanangensis]|uniref:Trichothecene 3-O-acetyltransferase-like N-terminal domain-containing protein n=1 Tax=Aspergillus nanangensis TaxID=2582783 RepID=A0AAD4CY59_ASPNN|nr:hypothetical protein FE257_004511 [Aspergillus nanangensis]